MSTLVPPILPTPPPPKPLLTAEEFAQQYGQLQAELVKGVVKELPMPFPRHGKHCATMARILGIHVTDNDLGHVMSNDSWVKTGTNPDTVAAGPMCASTAMNAFPRETCPTDSCQLRRTFWSRCVLLRIGGVRSSPR